jgi:hypothetical protein
MLCRDMFNLEPTRDASSRVYASTPAPPPPAALPSRFSVLPGPPAVSPAPAAAAASLLPHTPDTGGGALGRPDTGGGGGRCETEPEIEFVMEAEGGYGEMNTEDVGSCCSLCSARPTCSRFVFERATGT